MQITQIPITRKFILKASGVAAAAVLSLASTPKMFSNVNNNDKFVHADSTEITYPCQIDTFTKEGQSAPIINGLNLDTNEPLYIQDPFGFGMCKFPEVDEKPDYNNNSTNVSDVQKPHKKFNKVEKAFYKLGKVFTFTSHKDIEHISQQSGVSVDYLQNILMKEEKFRRKVYNDGVKDNSDDSGGTLTVGYGHTGLILGKYFMGDNYDPDKWYEIDEENRHDIYLSKKDAYEILMQDLHKMKKEAEFMFGDSYTNAPQSIKDGIVDLIFNKGVAKTFNNPEQPAYKTKQDLAMRDYAAVVTDLVYDTPKQGLKKRNIYRIKASVKDLSPKDKQKVREELEPYYESVQAGYKVFPINGFRETGSKIYNRPKVKKVWNSAFKSDRL